ncbi:MAG TPA: hypothetical protein VLE97_09025 [Gaiellaceae bacterium]|nr:hypothetical protein [Gaiellaceae bacterium]
MNDLDGDLPSFLVWPAHGTESDGKAYRAAIARHAAEKRARDDYDGGDPAWRGTYRVRDGVTGKVWLVTVFVVHEPSFRAVDASEEAMQPATHVLWSGHALCEDLRLRGVPRDWPADQRWISLKDAADAVFVVTNRCVRCWSKVPGLLDELRQIGQIGKLA